MCSAHRSCPHELDNYQSIIMDLAVRFGGVTFYVYHRCFSAATASCSGTSLHTGVPSMWILSPVKCPSPANSVAGQPTLPSPAPFLTPAQQPLKLPLLWLGSMFLPTLFLLLEKILTSLPPPGGMTTVVVPCSSPEVALSAKMSITMSSALPQACSSTSAHFVVVPMPTPPAPINPLLFLLRNDCRRQRHCHGCGLGPSPCPLLCPIFT